MVEVILHYHVSVISGVQCFKQEWALQASTLAAEGSLKDPSVLLIEAEIGVARAVFDGLTQAGMRVVCARDGATGIALGTQLMPEIVLVGLQLPDVNSVTLVGQLVQPRNCGVVVLANVENEAARIASLDAGADDFLTKSASVQEMVARVRAVHRRVNVGKGRTMPSSFDPVLLIGPIRLHLQHRSVHTLDGRRVNLTSAEYSALETLARANGAPVSRDRLSEAALRRRWQAEDRSVDQLVFNLRQKLPMDEDGGVLIQSIRGSGYWMRAPEQPSRPRLEHAWSAKNHSASLAPGHQLAASA
jgi:two-component system response regulator CpxR